MAAGVSDDTDIRTYGSILRRRKWWPIGIAALGLAGASVYLFFAPTEYTATSQILVQPEIGSGSIASSSQTISPTDVATDLQILASASVLDLVRSKLHSTNFNVLTAQVGQTDVLTVTATDKSPIRAAQVANTYASTFVKYQTEATVGRLSAAELELQTQINTIDDELTNDSGTAQGTALTSQEAVLKQELAQLQVYGADSSGGVQVVSRAAVPRSPSDPKKVQDLGIGLLVGLLVGLGAAFAVDNLDDTIASREDLERVVPGFPLMGVIPFIDTWRRDDAAHLITQEDPSSPAAEGYRYLRTSLQFVSAVEPTTSILVTSPMPTEGKSSTVANLGVVFARSGQEVVLVSGDLRRPRLAQYFGLTEDVGLSSVVIGDQDLADALQPVPQIPGLSILGAGPTPPNPSTILNSPRMPNIISWLAERFDLVLIDSPPLLPVADATVLARFADRTLVVVSAGHTNAGAMTRATELLAQVGVERIGLVLNAVPRSAQDEYGYEYRSAPYHYKRTNSREKSAAI